MARSSNGSPPLAHNIYKEYMHLEPKTEDVFKFDENK